MLDLIDGMLRRYELGTISRRELLGAIAVIAPSVTQQPASGSVLTARSIT